MEPERLTEIFITMRDRLRRIAFSILGDGDEADDALADTFARLWARKDSIPDRGNPEAMSARAVRNECIDRQRRRKGAAISSIDDTADIPADEPPDGGLYDEVSAIIDRELQERDREILLLRDRDDWEIADIAARYGLSEPNVRLILSRARRRVREIYNRRNIL